MTRTFSAGTCLALSIYEHCLAGHILGVQSLFERDPQEVPRTTLRRIEEVELLLTLQQQLRGPH